jgi:hypothetical protein
MKSSPDGWPHLVRVGARVVGTHGACGQPVDLCGSGSGGRGRARTHSPWLGSREEYGLVQRRVITGMRARRGSVQ